jgi:hypothetical protein
MQHYSVVKLFFDKTIIIRKQHQRGYVLTYIHTYIHTYIRTYTHTDDLNLFTQYSSVIESGRVGCAKYKRSEGNAKNNFKKLQSGNLKYRDNFGDLQAHTQTHMHEHRMNKIFD